MSMFDLDEFDYERSRALKEDLESLFDSRGWQVISDFIATRTMVREKELIEFCPGNVEEMCRYNRVKGGLDELRIIQPSLQSMYEEVKGFVRSLQDDMDEHQLEMGV